MKERMAKEQIQEIENLLNFIQDKVESVYSKETQRAIDRYLERIKGK